METRKGVFKGMAYETIGSSQSPALFLGHPLGGSRKSFEKQYEAFQDLFYLIVPELPGHGQSENYSRKSEGSAQNTEKPLSLTLSDLAAHITELADHLEISSFHYLGISIGGMVGQTLGLEMPSRILSLALCNSSANMPKENAPFWDEVIETAQTQGVSALGEGFMERFFTPEFHKTNPEIIQSALKIFNETKTKGFTECIHAIKGLSYQDQIQHIKSPVLVTGAQQDTALPIEAARFIAEAIPNADFFIFEESSHLSQLQQASLFNATLRHFYKKILSL